MAGPNAEIMKKLQLAQAELEQSIEAIGPLVGIEDMVPSIGEIDIGASGQGQANHVIVDHYFVGSLRRIWAYASGAWRFVNITFTEEEGLAQIAFCSDRIDAWWDSGNKLTKLRCWKHF
ncbi:hypothetical protein KAR91_36810 [Candidatus Pacearchaeota archaeon]|nr:hypothetical protein [Candidatus Pacearchaeota archaeon]